MSLATRCTACGTVFRVVQDQLKVSEGWVRCGRCNEVFNALEGLFDLERDTPPQDAPAAASAQAPVAPEIGADPFDIEIGIEAAAAASDPSLIDKIDAQLLAPRRSEAGSTPATRIGERDRLEFPDAQFDPEPSTDDAAADSGDAPGWLGP
ncbi:MAG TPA: zinc-ribbon domain-containing protein, partial [Burkholderiaceae bacterium]